MYSALATCQANPAFVQEQRHASYALTQEGTSYLDSGSPEAQVFAATSTEGIPLAELLVCAPAPEAFVSSLLRTAYHPISLIGMGYTALQQKLGPVGNVAIGQAMKLQWIMFDKSGGQPVAKRKVQSTMASMCNDCNNLYVAHPKSVHSC
jgi:hypothetical protein